MARLLQAAMPLLLLASFALGDNEKSFNARDKGNERFGYHDLRNMDMEKSINTNSAKMSKSLDYYQNTKYEDLNGRQEKFDYLEALLVAKTCFREWIRNDDCHMKNYDKEILKINELNLDHDSVEYQNKVDAAKKAFPIGAKSSARLVEQIAGLTEIYDKQGDYFEHVTKALQKNFNEMVKQVEADEKEVEALRAHLNSDEFDAIFLALKMEYKEKLSDGSTVTKKVNRNDLVNMAMEEWVEAEKLKSNLGKLSYHVGQSREKWNDLQNKIPNTAKYNTRGATPTVKRHLRAQLQIICNKEKEDRRKEEIEAAGKDKELIKKAEDASYECDDLNGRYNMLKEKSAAYLMAQANQMRHEAMEKSNSIIAYVIHKMTNGGDMTEMHDAMKSGSMDKMDKITGHSKMGH